MGVRYASVCLEFPGYEYVSQGIQGLQKKKNTCLTHGFSSLCGSRASTTPDAFLATAQQLVTEWTPLPVERVGEAHLLVTGVTMGRCISLPGLP